MLTIFVIIAVAVLIVVVAKTEGAKPVGLVMIGALCIVLGSRATMVLTQNSLSPLLVCHVMAQDQATAESANKSAASENEPAAGTKAPQQEEAADEPSESSDEPASVDDSDPPVEASDEPEAAEVEDFDEAAPVLFAADLDLSVPVDGDGEEVQYITRIEYLTENRPEWAEAEPSMEGDVHYVAVKAGPYKKEHECLRVLDEEILRATREYIDEYIGTKRASTLIVYGLDEIKDRLIHGDVFKEKLDTSVGYMDQVHARLGFDRVFRNELDESWARVRAGSRLLQTGMGASIVFLLLGILFSYFRLDTATRGYFTGRLQFGAAAAILTLVAASVLLAKWIPWM